MATPINFSIAGAQRSGSFKTSVLTYPGGYSLLQWTLTGLGSGAGSDYENTALAFTATVYSSTDGGNTYNAYAAASWQGGPYSYKGVTDPPPDLQIGLGNLPAGDVYVEVVLTGTFADVGLTGSLS